MSHSTGRALPRGKHVQHLKTTEESCSPVNRTSTNCKSFSHCDNIDGCHSHEHKMKRLKTRKQRSKDRRNVQEGHGVGAPRSKSYHHRIKDVTHFNNCCQHRPHCAPKRDAVFAQVFPAAQEPSIITDCRLIGHRGLFNHEVKSIDIERLLSEQRKKEKVTLKRKTNMTSLHFPSSCLPSPGSSNDVAAVLSVEEVENEAVSAVCTETQGVCLENEKMACHSNSQGSDITPGQRVSHQFDPSFESENPIFSFANSATNALPTNNKKFKPIVPESSRKPLLTPSGDKENTGSKKKSKRPSNSSALEHGPNNQEPQHYQVQRCVSSPILVEISSSPAAGTSDTFDTQQQGSGLDSMSTSISTMAARLCHSLQLPILRRRNLLAESREMLLQALHERHGPQFQENLFRVQQCLSFTTGPSSVDKEEDKVPSTTDTDAAWPTDTAFRVSSVKESNLDTQRTSLKGRRKQRGSNWRSPPQPQKRLEQAAECVARPSVEKVGDLFDELLKPRSSSPFCIDFLPSETSSPRPMFAIPTVSAWEVQESPPQPWENRLNNVRMRESAKEGCFNNSFLNHVREMREISSGAQQSVSSRHSSLQYSEGRSDGPPSTFRHPPQPQDPFEFDRHSLATSLCPQVCYPQESNQLHSFYHFNHPQTSSFLRSHYSNVMHYPPSHMLDKGPSPILPSLPSPEHGFFPPMRLY